MSATNDEVHAAIKQYFDAGVVRKSECLRESDCARGSAHRSPLSDSVNLLFSGLNGHDMQIHTVAL